VRTLPGAIERVGRDALEALARNAGAQLAEAGPAQARFAVADDDGAARLVAALVAAGVPVVEAVPDESRLERLFLEPKAEARP
jgi:hypothetical protein